MCLSVLFVYFLFLSSVMTFGDFNREEKNWKSHINEKNSGSDITELESQENGGIDSGLTENQVTYLNLQDNNITNRLTGSNDTEYHTNTHTRIYFFVEGIIIALVTSVFSCLFCFFCPCWMPVVILMIFIGIIAFQVITVSGTFSLVCGPLGTIFLGFAIFYKIVLDQKEGNGGLVVQVVILFLYVVLAPCTFCFLVVPLLWVGGTVLAILPYILGSFLLVVFCNYEINLFFKKGWIHLFDIFDYLCGNCYRERRLSYIRINDDEDDYGDLPPEVVEIRKGNRLSQDVILKVEKDETKRKWNDYQDVRWWNLVNEKELTSKTVKNFKPKFRFENKVMRIQNHPFNDGQLRKAFMMEDCATKKLYVGKIFKDKTKTKNKGREYFREVLQQLYVKRIADEFNRGLEMSGRDERIRYIVPHVIQLKKNNHARYCYMSIEDFLDLDDLDDFEKYNNNGGVVTYQVNPDDGGMFVDPIPQAFSHFSFQQTRGYMMAVDIQGMKVEDDEGRVLFVLTDPAVHCESDMMKGKPKFAPNMNMGKDGWRLFFDSHQCNEVCKDLKLKEMKKKRKVKKK